jgi:excisionase family DNA binding protein
MRRGPDPLLTTQEVADICRVHLRTVRRWIASGELAVVRRGHVVRVEPSVLRAFLRDSK